MTERLWVMFAVFAILLAAAVWLLPPAPSTGSGQAGGCTRSTINHVCQ